MFDVYILLNTRKNDIQCLNLFSYQQIMSYNLWLTLVSNAFVKTVWKFEHGWVITLRRELWIWLFIHTWNSTIISGLWYQIQVYWAWISAATEYYVMQLLIHTLASWFWHKSHHDDVIMTMLASQITSLTVVYSIVDSGVNQRKHQSSASLAFVQEIHRGPVNFPHKWPDTRKMFPFDDAIMSHMLYKMLQAFIPPSNTAGIMFQFRLILKEFAPAKQYLWLLMNTNGKVLIIIKRHESISIHWQLDFWRSNNKENINVLITGPLWGKITGDW